jgi:hypothetical protein
MGVLLGAASFSLFRFLVPAEIPGIANVTIDWRVRAFATGLSILTGLSFGLVPALSTRAERDATGFAPPCSEGSPFHLQRADSLPPTSMVTNSGVGCLAAMGLSQG